jgi:hypothetical protein
MAGKTAILAFTTMALSAALFAAPAPWFKWRSKATGDETCAQTMQGEWVKISGPFKDSRCLAPGIPGE